MTDPEPTLDEMRAEIDRLYNKSAFDMDRWLYGALAEQMEERAQEELERIKSAPMLPWWQKARFWPLWFRGRLIVLRDRLALWIAPWLRTGGWDD